MRPPRAALALTLCLGASLLASPALGADVERARELFERGVADLEAGRFDKACPAIEESYRLDPHPGTLFTLAVCEEKIGHLATALRRCDEYLAEYGTLSPDKKAKQGDREQVCRAQRTTLSPRVPELTLTLPAGAPPGTAVTRDGAPVDPSQLGAPLRLDPGEHVVVTRGPGGAASTVRITLVAGEHRSLTLALPSDGSAPPPPAAETPSSFRLYLGGTLVGLGVASAVLGIVSTSQVLSAQATINTKRNATPEPSTFDWCSSANATAYGISSACSKAYAFQALEIASYSAGAALLGVGTYFLIAHRRARPATTGLTVAPSIGPRFTGVGASARF